MFMESGPGAGPIGIILPEKLDFRENEAFGTLGARGSGGYY
jgi:hypothetical protein